MVINFILILCIFDFMDFKQRLFAIKQNLNKNKLKQIIIHVINNNNNSIKILNNDNSNFWKEEIKNECTKYM